MKKKLSFGPSYQVDPTSPELEPLWMCLNQSMWAERSYFLQSGERLSEDPAPLALYAQPKMPFGNLLVRESVE